MTRHRLRSSARQVGFLVPPPGTCPPPGAWPPSSLFSKLAPQKLAPALIFNVGPTRKLAPKAPEIFFSGLFQPRKKISHLFSAKYGFRDSKIYHHPGAEGAEKNFHPFWRRRRRKFFRSFSHGGAWPSPSLFSKLAPLKLALGLISFLGPGQAPGGWYPKQVFILICPCQYIKKCTHIQICIHVNVHTRTRAQVIRCK